MKKNMRSREYNTDTARFVCSTEHGNGAKDSNWSESLYRKRNGEYFLYCKGGSLSKYASPVGRNEWTKGEEIRPLVYEAAREFVEKYGSDEDYEKYFGEGSEKTEDATVSSTRMRAADYQKIRKYAEKNGMKMIDVISKLVEKL